MSVSGRENLFFRRQAKRNLLRERQEKEEAEEITQKSNDKKRQEKEVAGIRKCKRQEANGKSSNFNGNDFMFLFLNGING